MKSSFRNSCDVYIVYMVFVNTDSRTVRISINGKVLVLVVSILIKEVALLHTLIKSNNFELLGCTGKASVLKHPWSHWASGPSIAATFQATLLREPLSTGI